MPRSLLAEWSRTVKMRDGKCMECGTLEDLHAHHILPKSTHPELALDVANGKTLCYRCHKREHDRSRPYKARSPDVKPQRKTLLKRIAELEQQVEALTRDNRRLLKSIKMRIYSASK